MGKKCFEIDTDTVMPHLLADPSSIDSLEYGLKANPHFVEQRDALD